MQAGGFLTGGYLVLVFVHALSSAEGPVRLRGPVPRLGEAAALTLAVCSLLLGLAPWAADLALGSGTVPLSSPRRRS
jgi:hypothetical protein